MSFRRRFNLAFGSVFNRMAASHAQGTLLELIKKQANLDDKEKLINSINLYIYAVMWKQMNRPELTNLLLDSFFANKPGDKLRETLLNYYDETEIESLIAKALNRNFFTSTNK